MANGMSKKEWKRNVDKLSITCQMFIDHIIQSLNLCPE